MKYKEETRLNNFGGLILLVLFFFILFLLSDNYENNSTETPTIEYVIKSYSSQAQGVLDFQLVKLPSVHKNWISFVDYLNCKLQSSSLKKACESQLMLTNYSFLKKDYLNIKSSILKQNIQYIFDQNLTFLPNLG